MSHSSRLLTLIGLLALPLYVCAQQPVPKKPRVLVSTDIGGTDPDDNQSMAHLLMYSDQFDLEGLISSPSYGDGSKEEIIRMINLYAKDLPQLEEHQQGFASPEYLRSITKQGRHGRAPYKGFTTSTEGSDWIISCAKKESDRPLWVLVWGGLEDVAQALHDAPNIQDKIRIYWIGGPNKKWSANSYAYIVEHFPDLWFIECNASYYGFFSDNQVPDSLQADRYFANYIHDAGALGEDYDENRYEGVVKMGDTPSLLYLMDGDPENPKRSNWGGSFVNIDHCARDIFHRNTTLSDTVTLFSVVEFHFKGPEVSIPMDSPCFTMTVQAEIGEQDWPGFYQGKGNYVIRYIPKKSETLTYQITSGIKGFTMQQGTFVVNNSWPGVKKPADYPVGPHWYSDRPEPEWYDGGWQGAQTVHQWRSEVLLDWAKRWKWLQ